MITALYPVKSNLSLASLKADANSDLPMAQCPCLLRQQTLESWPNQCYNYWLYVFRIPLIGALGYRISPFLVALNTNRGRFSTEIAFTPHRFSKLWKPPSCISISVSGLDPVCCPKGNIFGPRREEWKVGGQAMIRRDRGRYAVKEVLH